LVVGSVFGVGQRQTVGQRGLTVGPSLPDLQAGIARAKGPMPKRQTVRIEHDVYLLRID